MLTSDHMDDKWFKTQQKRVGATAEDIARVMGRSRVNVSHILTGRQRMSLEWAQAFAEVLQVPLAQVLEKAGVTDRDTAQQAAPGFSDGDAAPWTGKTTNPGKFEAIGAAFGARPGVDVWTVKARAMELAGILPGDFILVDTHAAEMVKTGDVVIAQVYSRGTAKTVLRRWSAPVLLAQCSPSEDEPVYVVDGDNVAIRGKVIANWRLL